MDRDLAKTIAAAIFYSSILASIGSVEMSSKFSVMNFSKDQMTLQRAADALRSFLIIGVIWCVGSTLALYAKCGMKGVWISTIMNVVMMGWIVLSYLHAFREAAKQHNLQYPTVLSPTDWKVLMVVLVALAGGVVYLGGYHEGLMS